jgi:hypothetical protein
LLVTEESDHRAVTFLDGAVVVVVGGFVVGGEVVVVVLVEVVGAVVVVEVAVGRRVVEVVSSSKSHGDSPGVNFSAAFASHCETTASCSPSPTLW